MEGQPDLPLAQRPFVNIQTISPAYATVMRVPLIRGREFNDRDDANAPPVAIVNQALVRRFWPNEDPVGKKGGGKLFANSPGYARRSSGHFALPITVDAAVDFFRLR